MMKKKWKKVVPIMLGSSFLCSPVMGATELTDRIYTTSMSDVITGGSYTVSNGDVLLDSSGYTGPLDGRKPVISTLNGDVNIDISEGNTLTIKGLNNRGALEADGSSLHGTITFNGGNLIVSNEANNTAENTYGLYANNGGQLDFNNDGNNKINLTVYMPGANRVQGGSAGIYVDNSLFNFDGGNLTVDIDGDRLAATSWAGISTHRGSHFIFNGEDFTVNMGSNRAEGLSRHGLRIETSRFDLDGKNFTVKLEGNPDSGLIQNQVGMFIYDESTVDIHATEQILIESDGYALHMGKYVQYDPINTAKFEADTIIIKSRGGIHAGNHAYAEGIYDGIRNTLEFTGHMLIESIARGGNDDTYLLESNGQAISVVGTDLTFNSNRGVTVYSENLTPQGVDPYVIGYLDPNDPVPYWLRAITLRKDTQLTANTDFAVTVNGGYNNTGLYVGESQAKFNGKTSITVMNGIDTARGIFSFGGYYDRPTIAEFYDDLTISLAGTQADYIAGIEAESGGKVDIKKGLFLNDNDNIYWSLNAYDTGSQIDVNSAGTGTVQVVGDISAYDGGIINIKMNTPNSYLTATSYANDSYGGTINMNIANDAVWNMTGNSTVTSLTTDRGHVNFMAPSNSGGFKTLTVHGDYAGSGLLTMNTVLGGDDSATDKLIVEGSTTAGTTGLIVNNYNGTGEQTVNGIEIITVAGESNGVFELRNRVVGGAYEYSVTKTGKNWYLTNALIPPTPEPEPEPNPNPNPTPDPEPNPTPDPEPTPTPTPEPGGEGDAIRVIRPETGAYIANLAAANALFVTRLHDRLGETQYTDFLTGETKVTSLWLRQEGGHNRSRTQGK